MKFDCSQAIWCLDGITLYRLTFYYQLLLIYHCNFVSVGDLLVQAPDEEFEEYLRLRHIISDQCIGDRNEVICFRKAMFFYFFWRIQQCFFCAEFETVSAREFFLLA
jgi:hypothetical protein